MTQDYIRQRERRTGWYLTIPAVLVLLLVYAYPIIWAFVSSLFTENLSTNLETVFTGFDNYTRLVLDGRFWQSMWNTAVFTVVSLVIELVLGLGIALTLDQGFRGRGWVRTIAILPWALPTALIALAWRWIFNDQFGVWNDMLINWFGILQEPISWLGDPVWAMVAVIAADVWKTTSFVAILLLAGLQSIPQDLYEAHAIDGASPWQSFRQITLPLIMPQILIAMLFRFALAFGIFDLVLVMTGGGPGGATEMVSLYIYDTVMRYLDFGYGAALVVVTFLILIAVVAIAGFYISKFRTATGVEE
ncbi:molybdenum ABC transporter permease subunit [Halomicronema hongdechloris C2206]|uniref:Molybdenum ABC transporter permease subunit n=1 Tax=Halomicronema hongdechloris C2206 TaxID=1641165 RepID=A0A1Z3HHL0_9CYAN|nr:sugar ABC transporter permease [Halomicronema hongdechloris]ASC69802.1 molybdenum ABC transporter permease subunit [Halomicronema hongdechloris C2206]